jgi:hypothetical protein
MFTFVPQNRGMQEFILTLVVIFVLFKVFGRANVIYYNQHHHHQNDGNYVDYEEIK